MRTIRNIIVRTMAAALVLSALLWGVRRCDNAPWPGLLIEGNTFFVSYPAQIKTLDPQASSYAHENLVSGCVVEPPLHYHYLKRPYQLEPLLLEGMPVIEYLDAQGHKLPETAPDSQIDRVVYTVHVARGIRFQPHPAFAKNPTALRKCPRTPWDFSPVATREVTAEDFKCAAVRMCDAKTGAPLYSTFASFLDGMEECSVAILKASPGTPYAAIPFRGCRVVDRYTLQYVLKRKYPQFIYWLAMQQLAPVAQEVLDFYSVHPEFSYGTWPVGTGAFMIESSDLNRRVVLVRNPEFRDCRYPSQGDESDRRAGLLIDAGKKLPFLERVVFNYEREALPAWLKFRQGYYDTSGVPNDMFDNAMDNSGAGGKATLAADLAERGVRLTQAVPAITYYFAFNMLDPTLGGLSEEKCKLRQALSMVIDPNEYIALFKLGNGLPAQGIIPPGIAGECSNDTVLNNSDLRRKNLEAARKLLSEAGYPGGVDAATGAPLVIHLDHAAAGMPDFKNRFQWLADRFRSLGVELRERPADLNRNRELLRKGTWQMLCERGWVADYPDPENFLFLFYSRNAHAAVKNSGPNYTNYASERYDRVFRQLETMMDGPQRNELIRQANDILAHDAPVCFLLHPVNAILEQPWLKNSKPTALLYDYIKYLKIDTPQQRRELQKRWNAIQ